MAKIKAPIKDLVYKEITNLRYKKGFTRLDIVDFLKDKYKLGTTSCYDYIKEAMEITADAFNKMNENALIDSVQFLDDLKQQALKEGDKKLVLEIVKELNKLQQLHVQKLEIDSKGIIINIIKDE